jgi:hypothetical protein
VVHISLQGRIREGGGGGRGDNNEDRGQTYSRGHQKVKNRIGREEMRKNELVLNKKEM